MTDEALRVVIAGGGTGGHLFPGVAVAREILRRQPNAVVTFAGTAHGIEARAVPREGFELDAIRSLGLKRQSMVDLARGLATLPLSAWDAWHVVVRRRPQVVVGVGGYSSGPVVMMAWLRGIPTLLHEQNAQPGLTNRLLARVARAVAVTFESERTRFGDKAFVSGNPVRPQFLQAARETNGARRVLIFGGSQGAHAINLAMVEAASQLARADRPLVVTHQTGAADLELVREGFRRAGLAARVEPFIQNMDEEMKAASLIVSRAGSTTLAEIAAVGRAAVLVPLPTASDDHQRKNAEALVRANAADMLEQRDLTGSSLATRILTLLDDAPRRQSMARAVKQFARPDAAAVIVDRVLELAHERIGAGVRGSEGQRGQRVRGSEEQKD
jgi:UDP-N-acetylglucosamine--N-acetylmuramyl-(pentapeptide) pyrophosphoryl-undecaprenol N-acetylglucosamine transferase